MLPTIIESPSVLHELQIAAVKYPRTWDAWEALKWLLVHNPGSHGLMMSSIPPPWYLYKQDSSRVGDPTFIITYSFNPSEVTIHSLSAR
jgi:hypothetical protein